MQDIRSHARTDLCCWVVFMTIMHDTCLYCNLQGVLPPIETMMGVWHCLAEENEYSSSV